MTYNHTYVETVANTLKYFNSSNASCLSGKRFGDCDVGQCVLISNTELNYMDGDSRLCYLKY